MLLLRERAHMHLTNLVILEHEDASPLQTPPLTVMNFVHFINHWQTHGEREENKQRQMKERRNLKSIQDKWGVNIMAFSSGGEKSNQAERKEGQEGTGTSGTV